MHTKTTMGLTDLSPHLRPPVKKVRWREDSKDITAYAKTGTLQKVSNIAGIMITKTGKRVAFCIMVNNFITPTSYVVTAYHDEIIRYVWNNY